MKDMPIRITRHDIDDIPRPEGVAQRTERNPEGVHQCERTGTPVKTEAQIAEDVIIREAFEMKLRGNSISAKITTLLDQQRNDATIRPFEELYESMKS